MIKQVFKLDNALSSLRNNHYTRKLKSNYQAYGTSYDFCRFYEVIDEKPQALICLFNATMVIATYEGISITDSFLSDISTFISMNKPEVIELDKGISSRLYPLIKDEYSQNERTSFEFREIFAPVEIMVDELPKLDSVYKILAESFPQLKSAYHLWITDTSHRLRRGLSQTFLVGDYTTATIQYIVDDVALIGHVATLPEFRGKHHARELLYWIGDRLTKEGVKVHLFARENRVSYYEEIGFLPIFTDIVFEREFIDD